MVLFDVINKNGGMSKNHIQQNSQQQGNTFAK